MHITQLLVLTSSVRFVCGDLIANPYLQRAHTEAKNLMRHATPGNRRAAEVSVDNNPAAMEGAQGYLNFDIYHDVDNCAGEPWVYYGLSLSYCYLGGILSPSLLRITRVESGGSVQYTCVEDEVSNTVNLTLNAFSDTKCATPSMSLEITRERNACVEGNVWSCSSNQEPWDVMNGTLGWYCRPIVTIVMLLMRLCCSAVHYYNLHTDNIIFLGSTPTRNAKNSLRIMYYRRLSAW